MVRHAKYKPVWGEHIMWPKVTVLSFDQSLANTGWSVLRFTPGVLAPRVMMFGTIVTEPIEGLTSWRDSLERGRILMGEMSNVMTVARTFGKLDAIVHEQPALMGMTKFTVKAEGGPIAAMCVHGAASQHQQFEMREVPIVMVEIRQWKKHLGVKGDDKSLVAESLWSVMERFHTNEHVRDSIGVGIGAAMQGMLASLPVSDSMS